MSTTTTYPMCPCGHPVSHHRMAPRNQYNVGIPRCAYKASPTDPDCACPHNRDAALAASLK